MSSNAPFFIVGSGRSGTTLLRLLLNGHPRIYIPPETWFLTDLVKEIPINHGLSPNEVQRAIDIITSNYRWPDMEMDTEAFARDARSLNEPTLVQIIELVYRAQLDRSGKPRFGDKTPPYIHIVPQLLELYPDAKFIHLVRDGRDVAISLVDIGFHDPGCRCYEGGNFEWTSAIRRAAVYGEMELAKRILTVRYEDLIASPATLLAEICTFLDEKFDPQMLNWKEQIEGVPPRERRIHSKLSQPISASRETWRERLSPMQCFVMESCMWRELGSHGYPLVYNRRIFRPVMAATATLLKLLSPILLRMSYRLRRRGLVPANSVIL